MKPREVIRAYHEATAHTPERLRERPHLLDWKQMPDPFRYYEGAPVLDLPAAPPVPRLPLLPLLRGRRPAEALHADGPGWLSCLLLHSAAISATRVAPSGMRYALRVNPSSGNLHPTEFHFAARGLDGWPNGLYHYCPANHTAEQLACGTSFAEPLVFLLTTIAWREAWKYRERAYRYCLLDLGHAVEALVTAGRALGWDYELVTAFEEQAEAERFRLSPDEWPLAKVIFELPGVRPVPDAALVWQSSTPNRLSERITPYPEIAGVHVASGQETPREPVYPHLEGDILLPEPAGSEAAFAETVRSRRSALDFQAEGSPMSFAALAALLDAGTLANAYVDLWVFAHRVDGLSPGLYRLRQETRSLELVREGDQRVMAAALSLSQPLAGNGHVAFAMTGDPALGYRDLHIEAGRLGHRLYLGAEALGFRATGIGAFFDQAVLPWLGLEGTGRIVLYHFAVGHPVPDARPQVEGN